MYFIPIYSTSSNFKNKSYVIDILHIWVPWFHGSTQNCNVKIQKILLGGTMELWNQGSRLHIWGSMIPWFHPKKFWWNRGTMELWNLGSRLHIWGSLLEPWNHGTQMCIMSIGQSPLSIGFDFGLGLGPVKKAHSFSINRNWTEWKEYV